MTDLKNDYQDLHDFIDNLCDYEDYSGHIELGFEITERQLQKIQEWKNKHYAKQHGAITFDTKLTMGGTACGTFSYRFIPTGLGTFGICVCEHCQAKAFREAKGDKKMYRTLLKEYDAEFTFQEAY